MSEIQVSTPLMQSEHSREYDLEALRAFDEKYPEYAFDPFLEGLSAVPTSQKAVQADNSPQNGQAQPCPLNEKIQWDDKNDYFNDQDVAAIFEKAVAGIESSIIESSVIGNHEVDLSGNTQVPLPSWALDTNQQENVGLASQQDFPHDFDSFEQEHWDFYTNEILKDETLMTKEWDDLICWLNESYTKAKAEEKGAKAPKASEERPCVDQSQNDQDSNSAPQSSESRSHLGKGRVQHPMAPPQHNAKNGAGPSPYQKTNTSGLSPQGPSTSKPQDMSNQSPPSYPGNGLANHERLHHSQPQVNGRTQPIQGPVQQGCNPRSQYQQPHGPPNGNMNGSRVARPTRDQGVVQGMNGAPRPQRQQSHGPSIGHTNNSHSTPLVHPQTLPQGINGTPRAQYQQLNDPSIGNVNKHQSTPLVRQQGFAPGMNGAPRVQHQQSRGPLTGSRNNIRSTPPVRQQGFAQGTNDSPKVQHQQSRGPPAGSINNIQSTPFVRQQGFAQGTNGTPRAQSQQLPGPPAGLTYNSQSTPPVQHQGSVQGMRKIPSSQLSTLGPGGRTVRQVPRQILGRRGREATEDEDDVVELDPSVCASQFLEDGSRSKRRRNNANPGTRMEPRPQRRQNGSTHRPQYYGAAGAPVPIGLPDELPRNTKPTPGFVENAMRPCVLPKAIDSNGRLMSSTQGTHTLIQVASNAGHSSTQQAGHENLAAGRMNGGRRTSHVPENYLRSLQRIPGAHQGQQNSEKHSREGEVGGLSQGTNDTQQTSGVTGEEEGNGDRRKQAQHGQNATIDPLQLHIGGLNHPPPVPQPSYPQQPGRILGEVLDDSGLEPGDDVPPKISGKRNRSESMNEHEEDSRGPAAKRRRTPSNQGPNLPPEAPRREKEKRRKSKQDEHIPPPVFSIDDGGQDASHTPRMGATEQADEMISANQAPQVANAQAPDPPNGPPTAPAGQLPPPDIRDHPPTTEWECVRLTQALSHTRWAYEQWTGTDAPPTNRLLSYNAQFGTILSAFGEWWHSSANPENMLPMEWLVQLDPWEGGVADWKEPGKDGMWWVCMRRGFYAARGADGGLVEPDFRWDVRDYEWFKSEDEGGWM